MAAPPGLDALAQDLRATGRSLRRTPGFALVAVLTLTIGVGATTALFSTVNATMLRPLPFARPGQLVSVRSRLTTGQITTGLLSPLNLGLLRDPSLPVERAAGFSASPQDLTLVGDDGQATPLLVTGVSEGFFQVLGLPLAIGPGFTPDDHAFIGPDAPVVGVLSHRAWTTLLGGDPGIVGQRLRLVEIPGGVRIAGVAAAALDLPRGTDVWLAARINPRDIGHGLDVIARVRPGTALDLLRERADTLLVEQARTSPTSPARWPSVGRNWPPGWRWAPPAARCSDT
ncbi:MAG: ABC transporter permease [Vicinamibacterales bacterium]